MMGKGDPPLEFGFVDDSVEGRAENGLKTPETALPRLGVVLDAKALLAVAIGAVDVAGTFCDIFWGIIAGLAEDVVELVSVTGAGVHVIFSDCPLSDDKNGAFCKMPASFCHGDVLEGVGRTFGKDVCESGVCRPSKYV